MSSDPASPSIEVRRSPRARRASLRVDPVSGQVRVTLPPRTPLAVATRLVDQHQAWIASRVAAVPAALPIRPGAHIPYRGDVLELDWRSDAPRQPVLDSGRLIVGGPMEHGPTRILAWLKRSARDHLTGRAEVIAGGAGLSVGSVRIGDPRSRWGSCNAAGHLAFSWRLILAPDWVSDAVVAHEVAHLVHMNHGPAFHRLVAQLSGDTDVAARAWLRHHGVSLHRVGTDGG